VRQLELGRAMLSGRSRGRENEADGERGASEQTRGHNVADLRTGIVSKASGKGRGVAGILICHDRRRNAISGSCAISRRRWSGEPLYCQPRRWLRTKRMIGAMSQLRCS